MITGKSANEEFTKHYGKAGYTGILQGAVRGSTEQSMLQAQGTTLRQHHRDWGETEKTDAHGMEVKGRPLCPLFPVLPTHSGVCILPVNKDLEGDGKSE